MTDDALEVGMLLARQGDHPGVRGAKASVTEIERLRALVLALDDGRPDRDGLSNADELLIERLRREAALAEMARSDGEMGL